MTSETIDVSAEQQEARNYFLAALNRLENETNVLRSLRETVFLFYSPDIDLPCRYLSGIDLHEMLGQEELGPFCRALVIWAQRFNMLERWVLDAAISVLDEAYKTINHEEHPMPLNSLVWMFFVPRTELIPYAPPEWPVIDRRFSFVMRPYTGRDRARYIGDITEYFETALQEYLDEMDTAYKELGAHEALDVRQTDHYEWFVRHQVQEWRIRQIIEHYKLSRYAKNTVLGAINKIAKQTGCIPFRHPPGRPRRP